MNKRKILIITIVVLAIVAGFYFYFRSANKSDVYYWRSVQIEKGDVTVLVTATGSMAADTSVDVGVQVSGIIAKIKADFNDTVKKGQVIAILDTTLYASAKLDATANLQKAKVAYDQAKLEFNRTKDLTTKGVVTPSELDLSTTALHTAEANMVSAQAQLSRAIINLKYCTITAPISGMIISRNVQVGNMVIASFNSPVLFTIANNLRKMQVQANVDEADIGQVKVGQHAKFTVDTYPNELFSGVITQVRHQPVVVQNVVNYVVIIEVENPNLKLMPGLTANSNISIEERKNVLKVASNAFSFTPPIEYINSSKTLPDSIKQEWQQKIKKVGEIKKQEIAEVVSNEGYLWIISTNELYPIKVTKGLNDGSFTEVSGTIKEGYSAATGVNQSATSSGASKTSNPFMPKFPSRKK